MSTLGDLEKAVMEVVWDADAPLTAYDVQARLEPDRQSLAATTVLTVLSRLEKKEFVRSDRSSRPHHYRAVGTRETHVAELMHEVLGDASDRGAVLERFIGGVGPEDVEVLKRLLAGGAPQA